VTVGGGRGFEFFDAREDGTAALAGRLVRLDRWSSAPTVVAASSIRDC